MPPASKAWGAFMTRTSNRSQLATRPVGSRGLALLVFGAAATIAATPALAAEYYVSPTGSDSAAGSLAAPFATLSKANSTAAAGDTIWVRGGTYTITSQLVLSKSGTSDSNRTKIWAYQGETPVLDASKYVTSNTAADVPVVLVTGNWMHLRGLEIANAKVGASGDHSYTLLRTKNASNNTFELLNLHHGFGSGLFIDTGNGGNLILNCDSHDNYDKNGSQGDGQNGDGFGVHYQTSGPSTVIRGCRAWMNSDDGYDFIYQEVAVTIESSFGFQNGYGSDGNGNGFKIGSSATGVRHIVRNNVAWKNKASGFYANHSSGGNTWYNNSSYNNGTQYNMLAATFESDGRTIATDGITLTGSKVHIMRNNVGFPNKNANMNGVDSAFNTWDLNISETSADFESTSDTGCTGPREADGSMPAACAFLKLKAGSPLIDKGTDVGLPHVGSAPDLGAFEYGTTTGGAGGATTATGGSTGSGGNAGGSVGSGGRVGSGGSTSSGGRSGAGGSTGGGGSSRADAGTGGSIGSGGRLGSGGAVASGGTTSAGGSAGPTGGTTGLGGALGSGGRIGTSSAMSSGGSGATGGTSAGGATATSPSSSAGGAGGGTTADQGGSSASGEASTSGCSCKLGAQSPSRPTPWLLVAAFALLALRRRVRR
jgi:MYXO-CTERM domain-containing protein